MPSATEHARRIKELLEFADLPAVQKYPNERITAFFYAGLHMIEAMGHALHPKHGLSEHYTSHGDRDNYLDGCLMHGRDVRLIEVARDYKTLKGYSMRSRYLSDAKQIKYRPVSASDADDARKLLLNIKAKTEDIFASEKSALPGFNRVLSDGPSKIAAFPKTY